MDTEREQIYCMRETRLQMMLLQQNFTSRYKTHKLNKSETNNYVDKKYLCLIISKWYIINKQKL